MIKLICNIVFVNACILYVFFFYKCDRIKKISIIELMEKTGINFSEYEN